MDMRTGFALFRHTFGFHRVLPLMLDRRTGGLAAHHCDSAKVIDAPVNRIFLYFIDIPHLGSFPDEIQLYFI